MIKQGVAIIMSMVEIICQNRDFKHGDICIAFTPDEEVGRGTENFDVKRFGADYAYTVDGGRIDEFSFENFNAYKADVTITGRVIIQVILKVRWSMLLLWVVSLIQCLVIISVLKQQNT